GKMLAAGARLKDVAVGNGDVPELSRRLGLAAIEKVLQLAPVARRRSPVGPDLQVAKHVPALLEWVQGCRLSVDEDHSPGVLSAAVVFFVGQPEQLLVARAVARAERE